MWRSSSASNPLTAEWNRQSPVRAISISGALSRPPSCDSGPLLAQAARSASDAGAIRVVGFMQRFLARIAGWTGTGGSGSWGASATGFASIIVAVAVVVVFFVVFLVIVPVFVFILVVVEVLVVVFFLGSGPAFRLLGELEVKLLPGLVVDFLDVPVLVLQLDELPVLVDRQDLEDLLVVEALVPLSRHGVVIAAH